MRHRACPSFTCSSFGRGKAPGQPLNEGTTLKAQRLVTFAVLAVAAVTSGALLAQAPQAVGTWAPLQDLQTPLSNGASVALSDGRTLIVGGMRADGTLSDAITIYDAVNDSLTPAGVLVAPRSGHSATLLKDGRVLIMGGVTEGGVISTDVEMFDPAAGTSMLVAQLAEPRRGHVTASLPDGTVLIAGGATTDGVVLQTAAIFDPETNSVSPLSTSLQTPRVNASATTLLDGEVLIAGGSNGTADQASAEIYDRYSRSFAMAQTQMTVARQGHSAVLLPHNGGVLIVGGASNPGTDLFLPAVFPDPYSYGEGAFTATGEMATSRAAAVAGPTSTEGYAFAATAGAVDGEVYRFATIKTDKDDYAPGELAMITGSGWQPNEEVTLLFQEDPAVHDDYVVKVIADGNGNLFWNQWAPEHHDIGVRFYLTASGSQSRAQMTFTDAPKVASVTMSGQSGTLTSGTAGSATYTVTVNRGNAQAAFSVVFTTTALPSGVTFTPGSVDFTKDDLSKTVTFALNTTAQTPAGNTPFTLRAASGAQDFAEASSTLSIGESAKSPSTTTVNCPPEVTYNSAQQTPCSATVTGAGGLNQSVPVTYSNNVNAGTATATASFGGDANHTGDDDTVTFTIVKAVSATVVSCQAGPFTYTGQAQSPCTATVTGAGGLNLTPSPTYANNINAGTATASYSYAGDDNHTGSSDSETFTIDKATSATVVSCPAGPFTYTGQAQEPCSTTVTGAGGLDLTPAASYADNINAGTATASYSYAGDDNHTGSSDSKTFTIDKAPSTTVVTIVGGPFSYTGAAQTPATVAVTGAGALDLTPTASYADNINAGTATASYSYAGDDNHTGSSDSKTFSIDKAASTVEVICTGAPFTYTGSAQTPCSARATGAGALDQVLTVSYINNTNAGPATASASFTGDANHTGNTGSANFTIDKASLTVKANDASRPFGVTNPTFSGSYSGQKNGETFTMSFSTSATTSSAVGTYPIVPSATGPTINNYSLNPTNGTLTVGAWSLKGFYQPVGETNSVVSAPGVQPAVSGATVWNSIKGGQTVPLKFNIYREVGGPQVTTVADAFTGAGFSAYQLPSCSGGYTDDEIPLNDLSTGGTELRWDGTQFIQNWKTPKVSGAELCYRAVITAKDGTTITAFFKVKK